MHHTGSAWQWPKHPVDQDYNKVSGTAVPLRFAQGDLDISTPFDNFVLAVHRYGATQDRVHNASTNLNSRRFVAIPAAPQVALVESPVVGHPVPCGLQLLMQFLNDPTADIDDARVQNLVQLDFVDRSWWPGTCARRTSGMTPC